ncbi:hypothetical protein GCM10009687_81240 [Asanoa iriomotensis]|uniref:Uncharacterized protein n=1 Tax=Asanoa iriomotensis TaxID=234613 RepID=A0ABQ4CHB4_9ACTN|nr:hypothetical protein Air01nite_78000 [Asanoa iriomotensis]
MSVPVPLMSDCTRANAGTPASRPIALITATAPSRARFFIVIPRKNARNIGTEPDTRPVQACTADIAGKPRHKR